MFPTVPKRVKVKEEKGWDFITLFSKQQALQFVFILSKIFYFVDTMAISPKKTSGSYCLKRFESFYEYNVKALKPFLYVKCFLFLQKK